MSSESLARPSLAYILSRASVAIDLREIARTCRRDSSLCSRKNSRLLILFIDHFPELSTLAIKSRTTGIANALVLRSDIPWMKHSQDMLLGPQVRSTFVATATSCTTKPRVQYGQSKNSCVACHQSSGSSFTQSVGLWITSNFSAASERVSKKLKCWIQTAIWWLTCILYWTTKGSSGSMPMVIIE